MEVENIYLQSDSTSVEESGRHARTIIPTNTISHFESTNHRAGIPKGVFFGALVGGIATAVFQPTSPGVGGGEHKLSITGGIVIGGAVGLVVGFAAGEKTIYKLEPDSLGVSDVNRGYGPESTAHNTPNNDAGDVSE